MSDLSPGARFLRQWRERNDPAISQVSLAAALGIGQSTVCSWETGKRRPSLPCALLLEKHTGGAVPTDSWLVPGPVRRGSAMQIPSEAA